MSDVSWHPGGQSVCTKDIGSVGKQVRTEVTERDANSSDRMAMGRGDWSRAELILKVETTDKRGRVDVSVKRIQKGWDSWERSTHTSTSDLLSK